MPFVKRSVYHTHIKFLAHENLLASHILEQIPKSTIARWRREDPNRYKSFHLNLKVSADYEVIHHFAHNVSARRTYAAYVRIIKSVLAIAHALPGFHRAIKMQNKQIVELINRVKNLVGLRHALHFFNISLSTFRNWSAQSLTQCFESLTGSCNRFFHNQLSRPEVLKLKELLTDSQFRYWPVSSIALYALRKNILPLSLNTWYKYINKLGLVRSKPPSRRKKSSVSVRAERPHQIWHADITVFFTADQLRHYIYLVVDNFSRKIISWLISGSVNAGLRKVTIEEALKNVKEANPGITLITDGGPENKLQDFLFSLQQPVEQRIALVDVHYSNAMIEGHNKLIKYNYLYRMEIAHGAQLRKIFPLLVDDFNNRPHISLNGLTPNEAEQNLSVNKEQLHLYINKATQKRKKYNQNHLCRQCNN